MELQLAINVLMIAHHFTIELSPANYKLRFNPIPSMKPSKKLKFRIVERRRELNVYCTMGSPERLGRTGPKGA